MTRVLIVEDLPTDAGLAEREIRKALPDCQFRRVETREDYLAQLDSFRPDVIVSDYKLPYFDGLSALKLAMEHAPNTPLIILTGSMNEDTAVECMKAGAWDYVIKEHLRRLGPAVVSALDQRRVRCAKTEALNALKQSEELFRNLFEQHSAVKLIIDPQTGDIVDANEAAATFYGWSRERLKKMKIHDINTLVPGAVDAEMQRVVNHKRVHFEFRHRRADGSIRDVDVFSSTIQVKGKDLLHSIVHDVTDRKIAERALLESENRYRNLIMYAPDAIFVNHENRVILVNRACMKLFGAQSEQDLIGRSPYELLHPDFHEVIRERIRHLRIKGKPVTPLEEKIVRLDGTVVDVEVVAAPFQFGNATAIHVILRDISERKKTEQDLRESEERFSKAFKNNPAWLAIVHMRSWRIVEVNDAWTKVIGYTRDEAIGRTTVELGIYDEASYRASMEEVTAKGSVQNVEVVAENRLGKKRVLLVSREVVEINGESHLLAMGLDITDRKKSEEALRASEERFRILADGTFEGVVISVQGVIRDCNDVFCNMTGYSWKQIVGMNVLDMIVPAYREVTYQHMHSGNEDAYDSALIHQDGHTVPIQVKGKLIPYEGGTARIASVRDMSSAQKAAEAERRLATAIEQAAEGILITDRNGLIQYVNPAIERITGYRREELIGNTPQVFKSGEHDPTFYKDLWDTITTGRTWSGQFVDKTKDGKLVHQDATISPVKDSSGAICSFVAVKRDITEHLELSRQLYQAQKMEAIGTLAGGVAHDFNNILQVVLGYAELILCDQALPETCRSDLGKVYDSAKRGADLVQRLLTFSRKTEIRPQPLNLNRRITDLKKMLARTIPKMIDMELVLGDNLASIHADATQIDQVLMNLAVNARDAMPDGGRLIFETADVMLDEEYVRRHVEARIGRHVLLMVTDTGSGMDKDTLEHIFEPFYTTKQVGEGTGLGLAMVHGIVRHHGGHIRCYSEPGEGTTFKIYFPAMVSDEEKNKTMSRVMPRGGSETLLLVDDEEMIRDLCARILTKAGYTVLTASNGKEALEVYAARKDEIALVMLDLIMPEMGGKQCLEALLSLNPLVKVVIASGFSANGLTKGALAAGAKGFVNKPYDIRQVLEVVRSVLDEPKRDAGS